MGVWRSRALVGEAVAEERVPRVTLGFYVYVDKVSDMELAKLGISRGALRQAVNATEYNAGVLVLNTKRWGNLGYLDRIKHWQHVNFALHGKLFRGNDQTMLMLAFQVWQLPATRDFIVVEREWNVEVHVSVKIASLLLYLVVKSASEASHHDGSYLASDRCTTSSRLTGTSWRTRPSTEQRLNPDAR